MATVPITVDIPFASGVARLVKSAITANTDGLASTIRGLGGRGDPFVKPNTDGSWPKQTRDSSNPGTLFWLRHIDDTSLAAMPTAADGFIGGVRGDLVFPLPDAPIGSGTTMLFSDSFTVTTNADFDTRTGDAYAGGTAPTWVADKTQAGTDARCRVLATAGLNIYNNVWLRTSAPALPTTGTWRAAFTITEFDPNHTFQVPLRAPAYNDDTARTWLKFSSSGGLLVITLHDTTDGSVTLGQATLTLGQTRVTVEYDGATARVSVGGTALTPGATATRLPRLGNFTLHAPSWHFISLRELTVETL